MNVRLILRSSTPLYGSECVMVGPAPGPDSSPDDRRYVVRVGDYVGSAWASELFVSVTP